MSKIKLVWRILVAVSPPAVARAVYGGRLRVVDGRRADPKAQAVGELASLIRRPDEIPVLEESRAGLRAMAAKFDLPCPAGVNRRDIEVPGAEGARPARLYDVAPLDGGAPRPTLLFLHGGAWIQGDLDTHDGLCGRLALEAGVRVLALDYRLAPEHKFPAGLEDAAAAYRALRADGARWGVDAARLSVGGDSAGGNLTAALMHMLAESGEAMPKGQVLIYPALDTAMDTPSMRAMPDAWLLPRTRLDWYLDLYLPQDQDRRDPRVAPACSGHLAGQPPAFVLAAGHDPLWDEALSYADALEAAGVSVTRALYPGQIHAFVSATKVIPEGRRAISEIAGWLRGQL